MLRKLIGTMVVMLVAIGIVTAEEWQGVITKVDGNKITFQKTKKAAVKGEAPEKVGDPVVLTVAKDAKIAKGAFNKDAKKFEAGDKIEGGLTAELFTKIGEKGVGARVTTDDGKTATQILVTGGKKKKGA